MKRRNLLAGAAVAPTLLTPSARSAEPASRGGYQAIVDMLAAAEDIAQCLASRHTSLWTRATTCDDA